jgi:transcriptional regulator GlxA family with amidase domain
MIAEPLQDLLLDGLLRTIDHPYREALDTSVTIPVLEECWRQHRGVRPMRYVHGVRLVRTHRDLEEHAPGETTVTATTFRWGFARPARFATSYAGSYGLPPDQTLRGPAYA